MKRILAGLALALLIASPAAARAGASITAGDGPFIFGQSVSTEAVVASWTPAHGRQPDYGYWARNDCYSNASTVYGPQASATVPGTLIYAQFADLTPPPVQSGFTFGPTPSWSGGGADCTVTLYSMSDGAFSRPLASDTFEVSA